ncbi:PEP-CTERM sorting domain-containing protein [bacterium]|nr:PEP-CTERM sorting domain-containing protein [bacterium]
MKNNLLRRAGPVLIVLFVAASCSTALAANYAGAEHENIFYHSADMSYAGLPEVSLAVADGQWRSGLVLAVATVNDRDRLDRLVDLQISVPSSRELQGKIGSDSVSGSAAVKLGKDSADEELKVAQPSFRLEPATMLLFGAGLIGVAEVLRRKKRIR